MKTSAPPVAPVSASATPGPPTDHGAHLQICRWIGEYCGVLNSEVRTARLGAVIVITHTDTLSEADRHETAGRLVGYPVRFELRRALF
jgi:hypothetical protein